MRFKYLTPLIVIIVTLYLAAVILINRLVEIHHFNFTASVFIFPITYIFFDICAETYGYRISRQILWCTLFSMLIFGLCITFAIQLPLPNDLSTYSRQFNIVMAPYFRTVISSIIAIITGQFINIYILSKSKILLKGKYFWFRSVSSSFIGDLVFTIIAALFIFVGRMPLEQIILLCIYGRIIVTVIQAIFAVPAVAITKFLKKAESIDAYDINVNFNPFKFSVSDKEAK